MTALLRNMTSFFQIGNRPLLNKLKYLIKFSAVTALTPLPKFSTAPAESVLSQSVVTASDISNAEIIQAVERAGKAKVNIRFEKADFRNLSETFPGKFDVIIAMDNALPHMLTKAELEKAIKSIAGQLKNNGIFVASIRDYDSLLEEKPPYSPPYIHKTEEGQRVSFQTWEWNDENYRLVQYIIDDNDTLSTSRFECEYRATRRDELTEILKDCGCTETEWLFPVNTGFYQPIVVATKR